MNIAPIVASGLGVVSQRYTIRTATCSTIQSPNSDETNSTMKQAAVSSVGSPVIKLKVIKDIE